MESRTFLLQQAIIHWLNSSVCSDQCKSFRAAAGSGICWLHHSPSNMGNNCFSHLLNSGNFKNVFMLHWDESKKCSCKTCPEPRYHHLGHWLGGRKQIYSPSPSKSGKYEIIYSNWNSFDERDWEGEAFKQVGGEITYPEHANKVPDVSQNDKRHTSSPVKAECPFHCECRDNALSW